MRRSCNNTMWKVFCWVGILLTTINLFICVTGDIGTQPAMRLWHACLPIGCEAVAEWGQVLQRHMAKNKVRS